MKNRMNDKNINPYEQLSFFDCNVSKLSELTYIKTAEMLNELFKYSLKKSVRQIYVLIESPLEYWYQAHDLARYNENTIFYDNFLYEFDSRKLADEFFNQKLDIINHIKDNCSIETDANKNDTLYYRMNNDFLFTNNLYKVPGEDLWAPIWYCDISCYFNQRPLYYTDMSQEEKIIYSKDMLLNIENQVLRNIEYKPPIYYIELENYSEYYNALLNLGYTDLEFFSKRLSLEFVKLELDNQELLEDCNMDLEL